MMAQSSGVQLKELFKAHRAPTVDFPPCIPEQQRVTLLVVSKARPCFWCRVILSALVIAFGAYGVGDFSFGGLNADLNGDYVLNLYLGVFLNQAECFVNRRSGPQLIAEVLG